MKSKYEWHVFKHELDNEPRVLEAPDDAADLVREHWAKGWKDAFLVPVEAD